MKNLIQFNYLVFTFSLILTYSNLFGQVRIEESIMTIPTYKTGLPNPMPRFFKWEGHQGTQRHEYPYPVDDNLSFVKTDVEYPFIHVENEFIDLGIMPCLGGRVYYAVDKTNNYDWLYHNHVVKPSLIGMLGNWVSGSLAWGFPHHHGPNTVEPMDYKIVENKDGSKTVWISNTDRRHRMNILISYTVFPNSSIIEMKIRPMNNTPIENSFLFWANPAVHVDSTYQVIFPPSVQYVTFHAKRDMTTWPIANGWYNGYDFSGIDVSWWKNTAVPSSFFSWDPKEGYFGGYDHGKKAGTVWVGNPFICPGMKYWADGNNAAGRLINSGLTDNDSQYLELMAGMYTDNQPDYSWIEPYESKSATMIWFPIRELEGLKFANRNGALNFNIEKSGKMSLRMNATSPHENAKVILSKGGQKIFEDVVEISPAKPYINNNIQLDSYTKEDDVLIQLLDNDNKILLLYSPAEHHPPHYSMPEPLKPFPKPEEIKTVEELYLAGLRLDQFYNPSIDPVQYYREALKRDPEHCGTNTQLGIIELKNYDWVEAEKYLRKAVDRVTANYTRAKDCEALYYLGLALKAQEKDVEAYDMFYRASWDYAWHTASYGQLAELDCKRKDYSEALEHIEQSLLTNADNTKLLSVKAIVLRKLNKHDLAKETIKKILAINPLDHIALNELYLLDRVEENDEVNNDKQEFLKIMRNDVQSYLELATSYMSCSFYEEANDVLSWLAGKDDFPMLYYYLGYCRSKLGDDSQALAYYKAAAQKPSVYCYPFRSESIRVLKDAIEKNSTDARAPYYLGNLLYEHQPEEAIIQWEKSRMMDSTFYIVHRNLGIAYRDVQKNLDRAEASFEKAIKCNSRDPRLLFELDEIYTQNKKPIKERYEILKLNVDVAKERSETLLRLATRSVEFGKYDEAIDILSNNKIIESEGDRELRTTYLNAYTIRCIKNIQNKEYEKAMKDIDTALSFPLGINGRSRVAQMYYLKALILEHLNDKDKAHEYYMKAVQVPMEDSESQYEYMFYQGLAYKKLANGEQSKKTFQYMLDYLLDNKNSNEFFNQFGENESDDIKMAKIHYLTGMAYWGLGDFKKYREELETSIKLNPDGVWCREFLNDKSIISILI